MFFCAIRNFNKKRVSNDLNLIFFLSELNKPHKLLLFFWARIPRRQYVLVGHDNLKVELQVFSHYKVRLTFYIYENHQKNIALNIWKNSLKRFMILFCSIHYVLKRNIDND